MKPRVEPRWRSGTGAPKPWVDVEVRHKAQRGGPRKPHRVTMVGGSYRITRLPKIASHDGANTQGYFRTTPCGVLVLMFGSYPGFRDFSLRALHPGLY